MSFKHGKNAFVMLGAGDLSSLLHSLDLSLDVDAASTTTFGATWQTAIPGTIGATLGFAGYYDPAADWYTPLKAAVGSVLTYCPSGSAIGDGARLMTVGEVNYAESSPVGGVVAIAGSFLSVGPVGMGKLLHGPTVDTNTTVGASTNDGAATATGWTAHLHVIGVSAGSWVVKLEDSANNSDWADVTGGAFTAATGATSQRLASAAATTAHRRYVRYTATRTGGAASDWIYFLLAYARNT